MVCSGVLCRLSCESFSLRLFVFWVGRYLGRRYVCFYEVLVVLFRRVLRGRGRVERDLVWGVCVRMCVCKFLKIG